MKIMGLIVFLFSIVAVAAVPQKTKNALRNSGILRSEGSIRGGLAGKGFSLLDVKTQAAKNQKLEKLTIALGDSNFQPHRGAPGYFHIENYPETKRVVINFTQAINAKFDEKTLNRTFAKSPFVKKSQLIFDPATQTLSMVLDLKKIASIRATPVNGNSQRSARLNIDLFEDSLLNKKKNSATSPRLAKDQKPKSSDKAKAVTQKSPAKRALATQNKKAEVSKKVIPNAKRGQAKLKTLPKKQAPDKKSSLIQDKNLKKSLAEGIKTKQNSKSKLSRNKDLKPTQSLNHKASDKQERARK